MTYKSTLKDFVSMGLFYGIAMGILFGLLTGHGSAIAVRVVIALLVALFGAIFFGAVMYFINKLAEKKVDQLLEDKKNEISKDRTVICDGPATLKGAGGLLFLTDFALEFYPTSKNAIQDELIIPLSEIDTVKPTRNKIKILTLEEIEYSLIVSQCKEWVKQICRTKKQTN